MSKGKLPAHLIDRDGLKQCSACGQKFSLDAKPTLSRAFAEHVYAVHKPKRGKIESRCSWFFYASYFSDTCCLNDRRFLLPLGIIGGLDAISIYTRANFSPITVSHRHRPVSVSASFLSFLMKAGLRRSFPLFISGSVGAIGARTTHVQSHSTADFFPFSHALGRRLLSLEVVLSVEVVGEVSPFFAVVLFFAPQTFPRLASHGRILARVVRVRERKTQLCEVLCG